MNSKYFNICKQNLNAVNNSSANGSNDKKPEIIEILESPEVVRKRSQIKAEMTEETINRPKPKTKRTFSDSDDEEVKEHVTKMAKTSADDMAKLAFEEMCETTIKELQDLFPEIDVCEIQDALIESNWSVFNASIKLGNLYEGTGDVDAANDVDTKQIKTDASGDNKPKDVASNEPKIIETDKMKSMDYYRKNWRPHQTREEEMPTSSHNFESIKNQKNKLSKREKRDINSDGSDESDGGEDYKQKNGIVCDSSSDDDSDGGEKRAFKEKSSKQVFFRTQDLKDKVVDFLQNSNPFELQIVSGISAKKMDIIVNLRPFANWTDCIIKFNSANLTTDILDNCSEILKSREIVTRLMNNCEEISKDISETVERLNKALDQPKALNPEMKLSHYQMVGLNWLALMYKKNINCILADEMGLGKTIQVIALFAYLRESKNLNGPHLVIVPSSTLDNWSREFHTWCPDIKLLLYYGSQDERLEMREQINKNEVIFDVILTTYNIAQSPSDKALFKKNIFKYCVFDEAHYLKNMKSSRFAALMNLNAKHRLLLTGTPLQNNLLELMSLLIFTLPSMFRGRTDPIKTLFSYNNKESIHRIKYINDRIEQAKKIMKPFVLRRLKSEVLQELPIKIEHVLRCPMSEEQELKYMGLIEEYQREIQYKKITFEDSEPEEKYKRGAGMLMELRKLANHPLLVRRHYDNKMLKEMSKVIMKEERYQEANQTYIYEDMQVMHDFELYNLCRKFKSINKFKIDEEYIFESGKFQELDSLLTKYRFEGKRVLLFSQFTIMLDIIEEFMNLRYYKYLRLDGTTKVGDRLDLIDKFNEDPDIFVFLLSTRAGGLGINLTAASVVIIHDIDFNPYNDKQAEDRCHRIGQTKEVIVYRLISQNSVEEGMHRIAEEKLKLGEDLSTNKESKDGNEESEPTKTDVQTLLRSVLKL